jgi:hypothetical protein
MTHEQLNDLYQAVTYLMTRSGGSWDNDLGANVMTETEEVVWEGIVASRPLCAPFKHAGWPLYTYFACLDPSKPKGDHTFRPRISEQGSGTLTLPAASQVRAHAKIYEYGLIDSSRGLLAPTGTTVRCLRTCNSSSTIRHSPAMG